MFYAVCHALPRNGDGQLLGRGIGRQISLHFHFNAECFRRLFHFVHRAVRFGAVALEHADSLLQSLDFSLRILAAADYITDSEQTSADGVMDIYFQVKALFLFDVVRHAFVHLPELAVDLFQLCVDFHLAQVAVIKLGDIVRRHLLPAVAAVNGDVLRAELPNGIIRQYIAAVLYRDGFIGPFQRILQILCNLQLVTAQRKRQAAHTVVAQDHAPVRVGEADTHRELVGRLFDRGRRKLASAAAILARKSYCKMQRCKYNHGGENQPRRAEQKRVFTLVGVTPGHREKKSQQNHKVNGAGQTAQGHPAPYCLIQKQSQLQNRLAEKQERYHRLPKNGEGRKCTHFAAPPSGQNTIC